MEFLKSDLTKSTAMVRFWRHGASDSWNEDTYGNGGMALVSQ